MLMARKVGKERGKALFMNPVAFAIVTRERDDRCCSPPGRLVVTPKFPVRGLATTR